MRDMEEGRGLEILRILAVEATDGEPALELLILIGQLVAFEKMMEALSHTSDPFLRIVRILLRKHQFQLTAKLYQLREQIKKEAGQ